MKLVNLIDEDFTQYKKPAMFVGFPYCTFKCDRDCGRHICQNSELAQAPKIEFDVDKLVDRYINNPITKSIACGGLEPFDSWEELIELITKFREKTNDDIIIYSGYTEQELESRLKELKVFGNIIVKVGRFIPDETEHFDEILGVYLASKNQYSIKI